MLTRRTLLQSAAAASLVPWSWAGKAWAAPSERITIGFIGVGTMGRGHLGRMLGRPDVEVVAICDVVQERIDSAAEMVQKAYADRSEGGNAAAPRTCGDFRDLLAMKEIDAVLIATPDHWHAIPCIQAAAAGKHIYCEKPLTHNVAEGRKIVEAVDNAKVVFQTGSQQRSEFGGHFRRAVEAIWNGRIGQVKTVRIGVGGPARPCDLPTQEIPAGTNWNMWLGPAPQRGYNEVLCPKGVHGHFPQWRAYREFAGGGLADMGAHHFDIAQWALGMDRGGPSEIVPPANPESGQGLQFIYPNGTVMIHNEFEGETKADCVFEGTDGTILVSRGSISSQPESVLKDPLPEDAKRVLPSNDHQKNWLDAIRGDATTICPAEVGHRSATICHLGNIGYRLGRKLSWNADQEQFTGDEEANQHLSREPRTGWEG
ncbi:MAG: Gfo/Idh/MocA family protein [Pirellulales bacterium]